MGMARFLANAYKNRFQERLETNEIYEHVALASADLGHRLFMIRDANKGVDAIRLAFDAMRHRYKYFASGRSFHKFEPNINSMARVDAHLYRGLTRRAYDDNFVAEMRPVTVPRYFLPRLQAWNKAREDSDRQETAIRARCHALMTKSYKSRSFPPSLRALIFERDGHRCCICGRGKELLFTLGLHLEVDHKVAWIDGGETSYSNGETLCSECNLAKHHTKHVAKLMKLMKKPAA